MEKKTWPSGPPLKICKHQSYDTNSTDVIHMNDRLSQLPHDVLMLITSLLTMKEVAGTSVLSHRWKCIWQSFPVLKFCIDSFAMDRITYQLLPQERSGFTRWVNSVVEAHRGLTIDELRVIFDLDVSNELDIDKWLVFALTKHVRRLELDFTPLAGRRISLIDCYTWPLECRLPSLGSHHNLVSLRSLCLKYVNVTVQDIKHVLLSCPALENLCIVGGSIYLTEINIPHSSLQLKNFEISRCPRLLCIDIRAPKLVSFTLRGPPIVLHIRDSLLSKVSIGNGDYEGEIVAYAYSSLSKYFSLIEHLSWQFFLSDPIYGQWNTGIYKPPTMTNLKHLELNVQVKGDESLLGWAYLIEASPVLEKLIVKLSQSYKFQNIHQRRNIVKRKGRPLLNLKTLMFVGFLGLPIDLEFASYVVKNSIKLKFVSFIQQALPYPSYLRSIYKFAATLPQGVAFVCNKPKP